MYQKTRGSGATLSECNLKKLPSPLRTKEPGRQSGSMDPLAFCAKKQEARGLHSLSALEKCTSKQEDAKTYEIALIGIFAA